jgi:hypothetical protein
VFGSFCLTVDAKRRKARFTAQFKERQNSHPLSIHASKASEIPLSEVASADAAQPETLEPARETFVELDL